METIKTWKIFLLTHSILFWHKPFFWTMPIFGFTPITSKFRPTLPTSKFFDPRQNFTDPRQPCHPRQSLTHANHEATPPTLFSRLFNKRKDVIYFSTLVTQWSQRSWSLDDITSQDYLQKLGGTIKLHKECSYFYSQSGPQRNECLVYIWQATVLQNKGKYQ